MHTWLRPDWCRGLTVTPYVRAPLRWCDMGLEPQAKELTKLTSRQRAPRWLFSACAMLLGWLGCAVTTGGRRGVLERWREMMEELRKRRP